MPNSNNIGSHVSDADLLMALDQELAAARQHAVEQHLLACALCRGRQAEFSRIGEQFTQWQEGLALPAAGASTAEFRARLQKLDANPTRRWPSASRRNPFALAFSYGRTAPAALVFAATFALVVTIWSNVSGTVAAASPNPERTPGFIVPMSVEQVCRQTSTAEHPEVPRSLAERVFVQYGISDPKPGSYEIDYLITPSLGGAPDVRNLWPQPYSTGVWNSHVKDALEDHLKHLVCSGELSLSTAQNELAKDWVETYKKYFHTNRPKPEHAAFQKDQAWE